MKQIISNAEFKYAKIRNKELMNHYIRGVFDNDGITTVGKSKRSG
ncbi:hypothetical protein [Clostridium butyricum]|nr:hypothetical protein [Clostridium butyricum]